MNRSANVGWLLVVSLVLGLWVAQPGLAGSSSVQKVEPKYVCMVTNRLFDREQIPVQVAGRTYYGCCEMCKERLVKEPSLHGAVDPVSGKPVDKAKAVIGAAPDGTVHYFESDENLGKFAE